MAEALAGIDRLEALEERLDSLEAENRELRHRLDGHGGPAHAPLDVEEAERDAAEPARGPGGAVILEDEKLTRRNALRNLGRAAAAGIGIAAVSGALAPRTASAATGTMQYGTSNDAGTDATGLQSTNASWTFLGQNSQTSNASAIGVYGHSAQGRGVFGFGAVGIEGSASSTGYPFRARNSGKAHMLMDPEGSAGAPTSGSHSLGELYMDVNGLLWYCVGGGTPGSWVAAMQYGGSNGGTEPMFTDITGVTSFAGVTDSASWPAAFFFPGVYDDGSNPVEDVAPLTISPQSAVPARGWQGSIATYEDAGFADLFFFHDASADKDSDPPVVGKVYTSAFASFIDFPAGWPVEGMSSKGGNNNPAGGTSQLAGEYTVDLSAHLPDGTVGVLFTLTAQDPSSTGFIAVWPSGAWPGNSNLNYQAGTNIATLAASGVASDKSIRLKVRDGRPTHVIISLIAAIVPE